MTPPDEHGSGSWAEPGRRLREPVVSQGAVMRSQPTHFDGSSLQGSFGTGLMDNMIRVVIVDDHQAVRDGLRALVNDQNDMEVSAEATNGPDALECVRTLCPSVVLMDVSMPGWSGVTTTRKILAECPDTKIIAVSRHGDASFVEGMLGAGAIGYVLKQNAARELIDAIRSVAAGRQFLDHTLHPTLVPGVHAAKGQVLEGDAEGSLTDTEQCVLRLVARACSNEQIAQSLSISAEEASSVESQAMRKAGLASRVQVVGYAQRRGWID
jgi:DNA-binding NarL/FixJ family response regulator